MHSLRSPKIIKLGSSVHPRPSTLKGFPTSVSGRLRFSEDIWPLKAVLRSTDIDSEPNKLMFIILSHHYHHHHHHHYRIGSVQLSPILV